MRRSGLSAAIILSLLLHLAFIKYAAVFLNREIGRTLDKWRWSAKSLSSVYSLGTITLFDLESDEGTEIKIPDVKPGGVIDLVEGAKLISGLQERPTSGIVEREPVGSPQPDSTGLPREGALSPLPVHDTSSEKIDNARQSCQPEETLTVEVEVPVAGQIVENPLSVPEVSESETDQPVLAAPLTVVAESEEEKPPRKAYEPPPAKIPEKPQKRPKSFRKEGSRKRAHTRPGKPTSIKRRSTGRPRNFVVPPFPKGVVTDKSVKKLVMPAENAEPKPLTLAEIVHGFRGGTDFQGLVGTASVTGRNYSLNVSRDFEFYTYGSKVMEHIAGVYIKLRDEIGEIVSKIGFEVMVLRFTSTPDGVISEPCILTPTGFKTADDVFVHFLSLLGLFPPIPEHLTGAPIRFELKLNFARYGVVRMELGWSRLRE